MLPLLSFSRDDRTHQITVVFSSSKKDQELMKRYSAGTSIGHVKISTGSFDLELDEVLIASIRFATA